MIRSNSSLMLSLRLPSKILALGIIALSFISFTEAGNTIVVTRGSTTTPQYIYWEVIGGSQACNGTTDYPNSGESPNNVRFDWISGTHATSSNIAWDKFYAAPKASPGYFFTCTDQSNNLFDTAYIIVNDCPINTVWSGTDCVGTPTASLTLNPTLFDIGGSVTWNLSSTNAQSCKIEEWQSGSLLRTVLPASANTTSVINGNFNAASLPQIGGVYEYRTTCYTGTNGTGTASTVDSDTITIRPTVTSTVLSPTIATGQSMNYSVTSSGARSCEITATGPVNWTILSATGNATTSGGPAVYGPPSLPTTPGVYTIYTTCYSGLAGAGTASTQDNDTLTIIASNLTAGAITPTTATSGVLRSFSATITNTGATSTANSFSVRFQVANDALGTGAVNIPTSPFTMSAVNGSGATSVASRNHTFSSAGTYYMRACADETSGGDGTIVETSDADNCGASWTAITVTGPSAQCGTASSTTRSSPPSTAGELCTSGTPSSVTTNANDYTWSCTGGTVSNCLAYRSPTCGPATGMTFNTTPAVGLRCSIGTSGAVSTTTTTYDWSCNNGSGSQACSTSWVRPDLTAGNVFPSTATAGVARNFTFSIPNNGATTTFSTFTVRFNRADDSFGTNAIAVGTPQAGVGPILAGQQATATLSSYTFATAGTFYLRACADETTGSDGVIDESNEGNNCGPYMPVSVEACGPHSGTTTPLGTEPIGTNACSGGALNSLSPVDTTALWRWSCGSVTTCTAPRAQCANGIDDDGDGQTDMADSNCTGPGDDKELPDDGCGSYSGTTTPLGAVPTGLNACSGGALNNSSPVSTTAQWRWSCGAVTSCNAPRSLCSNGIDDDGDGLVDAADTGCQPGNPGDNTESMSGTISSNPTSCTIAIAASTCSTDITWTVTNPAGNGLVLRTNPSGTFSTATTGASVPASFSGAYANASFGVYNNSQWLASTTVTINGCAANSSWNGSLCLGNYFRDNASGLNTTNCTILVNQSTCNVYVTWDIRGAVSPNIRNNTSGATPYTSSTGTNQPVSITFGSHTLQARDASTVLASVTATASCTVGTAWNAGAGRCETVVNPQCSDGLDNDGDGKVDSPTDPGCSGPGDTSEDAMSGTLSASPTSCQVNKGTSTCQTNLTWTTFDPIASSSVTRTSPNGTAFSNMNSGTGQPVFISGQYSSATFFLYNSARELASTTVSVSCAAGSAWSTASNKCIGNILSLNTSSCTILLNQSTCTGSATWDLVGANSPNLYNQTRSVTEYSTATGTARTITLTHGSNTIQARDGAVVMASQVATANCDVNTAWNGSICSSTLRPDLTAGNVSPSSATAGVATIFSGIVSNAGATTTGSSFQSFFQRASGANGTGTITDLPSTTTPALGVSGSVSAVVSQTLGAGTYSFRLCADKSASTSLGTIDEGSNEGNNCSALWTNVSVTTAAPSITAFSAAPNPAYDDESYTYTVNASNAASCRIESASSSQVGLGTWNNLGCQTLVGGIYTSASTRATQEASFPLSIGTNRYRATCYASPSCLATSSPSSTFDFNISSVTGSLTAPVNCSVVAGSSTCQASISWNVTGAAYPGVWDRSSSTLIWNLANGNANTTSSNATVTIRFPSKIIDLKRFANASDYALGYGNAASILIDTKTVTPQCVSSSFNALSGLCEAAANAPVITVTPSGAQQIRLGNSIQYNATATDANSDVTALSFRWVDTNGITRTGCGIGGVLHQGTATGRCNSSAGSASLSTQTIFTPLVAGVYSTYYYATDALANNSSSANSALYVATGTISVSSSTCYILSGANSCQTTLAWNATGTVGSAEVYINPSRTLLFNVNNNAGTPVSVPYGTNTFSLENNSLILATTSPVNAVCIGGSSWSGAICSGGTPTVTISPNTSQAIEPGQSIDFTSSANDVTNDMYEHNLDYRDSLGTWSYTQPGGVLPNTSTSTISGTVGSFSARGSNNFVKRITFNSPGTYQVQAAARDISGYTYAPTISAFANLVQVVVACPVGSSWVAGSCVFTGPTFNAVALPGTVQLSWNCNVPGATEARLERSPAFPSGNKTGLSTSTPGIFDSEGIAANTSYTYTLRCFQGGTETGNAVRMVTTPSSLGISVDIACRNGATNAPYCNACPTNMVFDGDSCTTGLICTSGTNNLGLPRCGNGIVERGEQCDGSSGIPSGAPLQCSSFCTFACSNGRQDPPSCGGANGTIIVGSNPVTPCRNGALQTSAPTCNVCPTGQVMNAAGICVPNQLCGNGVREGTEECDGSQGLSVGQRCTAGCCTATVVASCTLPRYTLTCSGANAYQITNGSGGILVATTTYTGPAIFDPTIGDTYRFWCIFDTGSTSTTQLVTDTRLASCANPTSPYNFALTANPKTIQKGSNATISFTINPPGTYCRIAAEPAISRRSDSAQDWQAYADRVAEAERLTSRLYYGTTDSNDPNGANRPMQTALSTALANGKGSGRITLPLKYSTNFIASCNGNPKADPYKVQIKVQVSGDVEG